MLKKQHHGYLIVFIKCNYLLGRKILQIVKVILLQLILAFTQ